MVFLCIKDILFYMKVERKFWKNFKLWQKLCKVGLKMSISHPFHRWKPYPFSCQSSNVKLNIQLITEIVKWDLRTHIFNSHSQISEKSDPILSKSLDFLPFGGPLFTPSSMLKTIPFLLLLCSYNLSSDMPRFIRHVQHNLTIY